MLDWELELLDWELKLNVKLDDELCELLLKELTEDCELLGAEVDEWELDNWELDNEELDNSEREDDEVPEEDPLPPHAINEIRQSAQNPLAIYEDSVIVFMFKPLNSNNYGRQCFKIMFYALWTNRCKENF